MAWLELYDLTFTQVCFKTGAVLLGNLDSLNIQGGEETKFVLQTMMRMNRITYIYYSMKNRWRAGCLLTKEMFFEIPGFPWLHVTGTEKHLEKAIVVNTLSEPLHLGRGWSRVFWWAIHPPFFLRKTDAPEMLGQLNFVLTKSFWSAAVGSLCWDWVMKCRNTLVTVNAVFPWIEDMCRPKSAGMPLLRPKSAAKPGARY